ncbi:cytochrome P450 4d2-like [Atheta coriaria]|uniref:cytochrome P450 4d2-like n=1 Tax=Dalotia coriaria TaxID=877792 RepID=UPI0031F3D8C6
MYVLLAIVVVLLTYVLFDRWERHKKYKNVSKIPGPPTSWLYGSIVDYGSTNGDRLRKQVDLVREYGLMVRLWRGSQLSIILSDPDKLQWLLSSNEHIAKSPGYNGWKLWLGKGLLTSEGNYWRKHRKIITPTFNFKILEQFTTYINSNSKTLIDLLKKEVGKKSFDIAPFIRNYNIDVIGETAMNTKINAQLNPILDYTEAAEGYMDIYIRRYFSFFKQFDLFFKWTDDYKRQQNYVNSLKGQTEKFIQQRKLERAMEAKQKDTDNAEFGIKKTKAFLDLLLDLQGEDLMTDEEIRQEVDTFMFAGHDTVTSSTMFCLLELANHADIQRTVYAEIKDFLGANPASDVSFGEIQNLEYLDLVVKETLRFHSVVPFIERELNSDVTWDGICLPKGTVISILPYAIHRSERFYEKPDVFDPDRFLRENAEQRHTYAYIPFSAGPRNCVGQRYALLATKAAVVQILKNFELLPAEPKFTPEITNTAVLKTENGICIQLKMREH